MFSRKLLQQGARGLRLQHRFAVGYSLQHNRYQSSALQAATNVTLILDNKPVMIDFGGENQTLKGFLEDVNGKIESQADHFDTVHNSQTGLQLDTEQALAEIFAGTNSIAISSSSSQKQVVITKPSADAGVGLNAVNHQELINLANELNKRLQDSEVTRQLHAEANKLDGQIQPLYEELRKIERTTNDGTDYSLLAFLSVWTMCTVSIGRLTWWEFSWDIMEPVAWATQAGGMLFWGWYYFITRNENSMSDIAGRIKNKKLVARLEKQNFDTKLYNELIERRQDVDNQLSKFKRW